MSNARILVVDDEEFVRDSLQAVLEAHGYVVRVASGAQSAIKLLRTEEFDAILTDMRMPQGDGNELLQSARAEGLDVPVLVLTGASTVGEAVTAMRSGAYDLLEKPVEPERLVGALERALERGRLTREVQGLRATLRLPQKGRRWISTSPAGERVLGAIQTAAASDAPVLISGPSGVGKSVVAEEVHRASPRASQPFVRVDCAALGAREFSSLLFGKAAPGRVAIAEGGSLFLDEISNLDSDSQASLLGLIETGEYESPGSTGGQRRRANVRIVATTNQRLLEHTERGSFRADLYWRLAVLGIDVPTLEARREDLPLLGRELGVELGIRAGDRGAVLHLQPDARALLEAYHWPGNVRELRSVLERALLNREQLDGVVQVDASAIAASLDAQIGGSQAQGESPNRGTLEGQDLCIRPKLIALERELVLAALTRTGGRRTEAAELLGVDSRNLGYYIRKHRITEAELGRASRAK
ncbi:MAG: DNA-binding NtrC family response regulator, partial [Planctomycetota bacterium]